MPQVFTEALFKGDVQRFRANKELNIEKLRFQQWLSGLSKASTYLSEQRILCAQRKLSLNSDSITSIAYESGFNSISRFNATFRKFLGMTPREYRKKI
jgi:AraC-like DNA-binding protein